MKTQSTPQTAGMESQSGRIIQYAKRVGSSASGKFLLAAALIIGLISIPLLSKGQESNEKRTLTGNWMVTVTRINPPPGLAPTFLSLMTFLNDRNFLEGSNTSAIRSLHHGNWNWVGHQQFVRSSMAFRFDAARNYLGISRLTATVSLSDDGSQFEANGVIDSFDLAGNLLSTLQSTEVGRRF